MPPSLDRHQRLRAVFDEAISLPLPERRPFLDRRCGDDQDLRSQVLRLLAAHGDADTFLEQPLDWASAIPSIGTFAGTERFRVVRRLGAGGMGVVYEVHDGHRGEAVALKTLHRTGAAELYRLKREFRTLADVTHPNLACLYELFVEGEQAFFTMELVNGVSFVEHVRGDDGTSLFIDRLVPALRQLVEGLAFLHRNGKLHRDIKPSNVLVTSEGRVVILDFGLAAEAAPAAAHDARYAGGGTPGYMSPEEAASAPPSEASDWYGVGVTLYEALTGRIPFEGSAQDILRRKTHADPAPPTMVASHDVPAALDGICMGLLRRDPARRLTGGDVLRAIDPGGAAAAASGAPSVPFDTPFVGRSIPLDVLRRAYETLRSGAVTVAISGPSGIGKSALVRHFLADIGARGDALVLSGRCYENESVPYKALDGVVDDLSRHLATGGAVQIDDLLPRDVAALTRVFPVLLNVPAIARASRDRDLEAADPQRIRRQAFGALATLLRGVAAHRALVVWIDDLQWADSDSIVLLDELLSPRERPVMLTLLCFRSEEIAAKPFLQATLARLRREGAPVLALDPMSDEEAQALIGQLLPGGSALTSDDRRRLTTEAGGSPFVLEQLARYAASSGDDSFRSATLADMFDARLNSLSPAARGFLETLAICARPMAPDVVCDACAISRDRQSLVVRLRTLHLIRSSGSSDRIETYHDRIREVLAGRLATGAVRAIHTRMAAALVARASDDCEALFDHYRGAGDGERASVQAGLAAEKASAALAFDRASSFYRHALDLSPSAMTVHTWRVGLASALANAGRPPEAAEAYLQAAAGAEHAQRIELHRRAAEQFLIGGHIDEGVALIRQVLASVGLTASRSPRAAFFRLVWRRERLRWRGLDFTARAGDTIDDETLLRLDTCWAAATGLALVDVVSASNFIAQHLHMALDAGEPSRIARGLAIEWSARNADWRYRKGSAPLIRRAGGLAAEVGTPQAIALADLADSITATAVGEWKRARASSERALAMLRDRCVGVTWELNMAQNMVIWALMYLGEFGEVSRRVPALLDDARRRGNLYLATELCTRSQIVWLIADQPDEGERETLEVMSRWSQRGFHRQHYSARLARVNTALYRGDPESAWRLLEEGEAKLRRSMLLHVQAFRVEALYLRGRCAAAMAASGPSQRAQLSVAKACARRIARERMPWATPLGLLVEAGVAAVEADQPRARRLLQDAVARFDAADMGLYAAVARRRLGEVQRDERGAEILRQADVWMATQHVRNPAAITRMLAPGFPVVG